MVIRLVRRCFLPDQRKELHGRRNQRLQNIVLGKEHTTGTPVVTTMSFLTHETELIRFGSVPCFQPTTRLGASFVSSSSIIGDSWRAGRSVPRPRTTCLGSPWDSFFNALKRILRDIAVDESISTYKGQTLDGRAPPPVTGLSNHEAARFAPPSVAFPHRLPSMVVPPAAVRVAAKGLTNESALWYSDIRKRTASSIHGRTTPRISSA